MTEETLKSEQIPMNSKIHPENNIDPSETSVKVSDVTFSYEKENILEDYDFYAKPGMIRGIHGPSGCGKSTLLKLIMRFSEIRQRAG